MLHLNVLFEGCYSRPDIRRDKLKGESRLYEKNIGGIVKIIVILSEVEV
jgi:hypothetical protein